MSAPQIVLAFLAGGLWMRACGKVTRWLGARGRTAVFAAFLLAETLTLVATLALYAVDDQLSEVDLAPGVAQRAAILAPWAILDLVTMQAPEDAYAWPGTWGTRALSALLLLPFVAIAIGWIGTLALRPSASAEAMRIIRAAQEHADACDSRTTCLELGDAVLDRIAEGRVTFRALAIIQWADGCGHGRGEAMSEADAIFVFDVIDRIDAHDGHPPSDRDLDELGESMMEAMTN